MKTYNYFPGCSCSGGTARAYHRSILAVAAALDLTLREVPDWNCCGSSPYSSYDEMGMVALSARNLALVEAGGLDLVTPCSSCFVTLNWANIVLQKKLKKHESVKPVIDEILAAVDLKYDGGVAVRHILDVMVNDIEPGRLAACVSTPLRGLRAAPYYGCQVVRPDTGLDHPENPLNLDRLLDGLGAEVADFSHKTACCGSSLLLSREDPGLELVKAILESAQAEGARCLVTVCPLCQSNLDLYQSKVNRRYGTHFNLPVLFFTQLMGIALGLDPRDLGLDACLVPATEILSAYIKEQHGK